MILRLAFCALLMLNGSLHALDTLAVGAGAARSWIATAESSSFLQMDGDSIWVWDTEARANLAAGIPARGGWVRTGGLVWNSSGPVEAVVDLPGLERWADGDAATAWGPDDGEDVERQAVIYIDLGGTFGVERIRFFPRLDEEHRGLILGAFEIGTHDGREVAGGELPINYRRTFGFSSTFPNQQPVVDASFERREVRFIRLRSRESEPWEIAEFEVYGDGTAPVGEFVSQPLVVRGGYPIWGQVVADGEELSESSVLVQTRTGPDAEPVRYFILRGDELEQVSRETYLSFDPTLNPMAGLVADVALGPVLANPAWSSWQTVTDGQVLSPGPRRYMQFRVRLPEPGTVLRDLLFEYVAEPLIEDLAAEISPTLVEAGTETKFTLSLEVHVDRGRGDTGFRYLQVTTPAAVQRVERVLVDDEETVFTARIRKGEGFDVDIWERVAQEGSFVQVVFQATVLRDDTQFRVRAFDLRPGEGGIEPVYQTAREEDVEPLSVGGRLVVRLADARHPLVDPMRPRSRVLTPNGDGVNDVFEVAYNLLKLTRPAPVSFQIFDLGGRRVHQGRGAVEISGQHARLWDGRDDRGERVPPGLYLYRIRVEADAGIVDQQGIVDVAY